VKAWPTGGVTTLTPSIGVDDYGYPRADLDVPDAPAVPEPGNPTSQPCSPIGVAEVGDTDPHGFPPIVSLVHRPCLPQPPIAGLPRPWIEGGYRYQRYVSQGREYDHQRHQVELAAGIRLPFEIDLSVRGRYAYVPYDDRTVFPDPKDAAEAAQTPDTAY